MQIALNTILLFLFIVIPGIIFLRFYYTGEFTKQFSKRPLSETFYLSIIPGLLIQYVSLTTISRFYGIVKTHELIGPLESMNFENNNVLTFIFDENIILIIIIYLFLLVIYAIILANLCYWLVRYLKIDKLSPVMKFDNSWHYYLTGEITEFKIFKDIIKKGDKVVLTEADIIVDKGDGETRLYKGLIRQHTISKETGKLDEIYLTDARRWSNSSNKFKEIPGNILV